MKKLKHFQKKNKRENCNKKIKEQANDFYKDYNSSLDEELFAAMLEMYYYNVPKKHHASVFKRIENQLLVLKLILSGMLKMYINGQYLH